VAEKMKDTKETKEAVCLLDGEKVSVIHRCIEVLEREGDPATLRMDSWNCNRSKSCKSINCIGKTRTGTVKNWVKENE